MNKVLADIYAEKDGKRYVISVRSKSKFLKNRKFNARYNLGVNIYDKADRVVKEYVAESYWMAIQFGEHDYSVYFGSLVFLNGAMTIPVDKCEVGKFGRILVHNKLHYFDFYENK